jgi:signal transduction histidine kinase
MTVPEAPLAQGTDPAGFEAYRRELERANQHLQQEIAERHKVEAALRAYAQRLDHLHTTQMAILSAQSLVDTLDITIRHIKSSLPCLSTTLVIYDFDRWELEVLRSDRPEFNPGRRLPILMTEAIETLRQGNHHFLRDIQDPAQAHPGMQTAAEIGGRSVLMLPLRYRDELIGAMTVTTAQVHEFTADELGVAREIAGALAIAIQHRRWLEAEQEAREREATLREVAQSLTADLELDTVLRGILDQLERIVSTTSSAIFLREENQLRIVASRNMLVDRAALADYLAGEPQQVADILSVAQPTSIPDTAQASDWVTIPGGEYIRSWLGIPLTVKGHTIGLLTLDHHLPEAFDDQDIARATILAAQAAVGIENARLFKREQASAARLEREVRERTKELQALYQISAAASENLEPGPLLDLSLDRAIAAALYDAGAVHLWDEAEGQASLAAARGLDEAQLAVLAPDGAAGRLLAGQFGVADGQAATVAKLHKMAACGGFDSCVLFPLRSHGRTLGTLLLMSRRERPLSPAMHDLLATMADQIGLALESIALRQSARQTAMLAERERIARELHDVVLQYLYSLINFAEATRESAVAGDLAEVRRTAQSIMNTAQLTLGEMRVLLYDLRSDALANRGLARALADRLATVEQRGGLQTDLHVTGAEHLPVALEDAFYRVALEALNNTFRHAGATSVVVQVEVAADRAVLRVVDDGCGFQVTDVGDGPGTGLSNMQRRAQDAGGTLHIDSAPAQGTRIEFHAPLSPGTNGQVGER